LTRRTDRISKAITIDSDGIASGAAFIASPNCDDRPPDSAIELLIVHAISLPPGQFGGCAIEDLFLNRLDRSAHPYYASIADLKVSAHFLVKRDGALLKFVSCAKRAWHAGASSWKGRSRCNDFSVGIELEGGDELAFEPAQYETLLRLTAALRDRYPITDMVGHSDVAPGRKTDPGPHFEWARYRALTAAGASTWR